MVYLKKRNEPTIDKRRRDTKERFMQFSLDEIRKDGYLQYNYRENAKAFGIAFSGLYNYWIDKEHLFRDLLQLASQKVYKTYREEYGERIDNSKPIDALALFGQYVFSMFQKEKHLMDFLFFSPTALSVYSEYDENERMSFEMLIEIYRLIDEIIKGHLIHVDKRVLLIKWWSFIHGYTMLVSSGIVEDDDFFIRDTIVDIIAGDNFKRTVDKFAVSSSFLTEEQYGSFHYTPKSSAKTEISPE